MEFNNINIFEFVRLYTHNLLFITKNLYVTAKKDEAPENAERPHEREYQEGCNY